MPEPKAGDSGFGDEKDDVWKPVTSFLGNEILQQYQPQDVLSQIEQYLPQVMQKLRQTGDETEYGAWLKIKQSVKQGADPDQAMQQLQQLIQAI